MMLQRRRHCIECQAALPLRPQPSCSNILLLINEADLPQNTLLSSVACSMTGSVP